MILLVNSCLLIIRIAKLFIQFVSTWNPYVPDFVDIHQYIVCFAVIFLCWLPFAVIRYPAGIESDAYHQIMMVEGDYPFSQSWPVVSTLFFGYVYKLGKFIFNSNDIGIFFTVIVQMTICDLCFSRSIITQKKLEVIRGWQFLSLVAYSFFTIYPRYLTSLVKDALYSSFVVLFVSYLAEILLIKSEDKKRASKELFFLLLSGVCVCVFRKNGVFILIGCLIGSIIILLRTKIDEDKNCYTKIAVNLSASIAVYFAISFCITNVAMIPQAPISAVLSIPFQQTARYLINYGNEVTETEIEAINKVSNDKELKAGYNPKLSDGTIWSYHGKDNQELMDYIFNAWMPQFFKHPIVYIEATFNNIEGFFYPLSSEQHGIYVFTNCDSKVKYFSELDSWKDMRNDLRIYILKFEKSPVFFLFCNWAIQIWIGIFQCTYVFQFERRKRLLVLPILVSILVCIACPTFYWNGMRYELPVIYSNILICSILTRGLFDNANKRTDGFNAVPE